MARILAIDYGGKRTGIAVTDPLQIIANGLTTINSAELVPFLKKYLSTEPVELIIIGMPVNWDESDTHGTPLVKEAIKKEFPDIPLLNSVLCDRVAYTETITDGLGVIEYKDKKAKCSIVKFILTIS